MMIFGSWTYNRNEVQLDYLHGKDRVELNDYSYSGIWDVTEVPAVLIKRNSIIKFSIHIRRKTLFYTVILIIPTVLMAFLSMMVFYLPADASEKITLAISILLALVVFLLLVSKILPPTSSTIPLMAKYLLLTFVMNIVTIFITVVIINVYFRGPSTHHMNPWIKWIFLEFLPRILLMRKPKINRYLFKSKLQMETNIRQNQQRRANQLAIDNKSTTVGSFTELITHLPNCTLNNTHTVHDFNSFRPSTNRTVDDETALELSSDGFKALSSIEYISRHMRQENEYRNVCARG